MPIITPAYPSMCATHNVTKSTLTIISRELARADTICNQILNGDKQWKDLFQKHTFFSQNYKYYLCVVSASLTKEAQLIWSGLVQSKVRRLVAGIEQSQPNVEIAHPYTKGFERVHRVHNEDQKDEVLQGSVKYQIAEIKTETTDEANNIKQTVAAQGSADSMEMPSANGKKQENEDGSSTIHTSTFYVGIELKPGMRHRRPRAETDMKTNNTQMPRPSISRSQSLSSNDNARTGHNTMKSSTLSASSTTRGQHCFRVSGLTNTLLTRTRAVTIYPRMSSNQASSVRLRQRRPREPRLAHNQRLRSAASPRPNWTYVTSVSQA